MTNIDTILALLQARAITPEEAEAQLADAIGHLDACYPPGREEPRTITSRLPEQTRDAVSSPNSASFGGEGLSTEATVIAPQRALWRTEDRNAECIAIVGASGRYPGADNLDGFWNNLRAGKNSIQEVPPSRWKVDTYYDPQRGKSGKMYGKWLGFLADADCFDPLFFGISPAEAQTMDPQHRLFLLEAYRAFASAGYSPKSLDRCKCGVYLGMMHSDYGAMLHSRMAALDASAATGRSAAIAAGRIAYFLNLKGPAISIDTACSSSLVATHLACQALLNHEIDMALAGGVTLYLAPESYLAMCAAGMLAPDGQCKTFDNRADGFVPGEGVGAVVLKRLSDAEANNDPIRAVIIASGVNQDGKTNGITAPSVTSQMELTREVYRRYQVHPESISYVEMHGTGTKLGDPIELEALAAVFKEHTVRSQFCAIGSVKSNIGHTSAAAGIAGLHKVVLALEHAAIPPTLNFQQPNEHFNFDQSPFHVNSELTPWIAGAGERRRAAVSAFGFSGTNAHLVVEEYVKGAKACFGSKAGESDCLVVLSARSEEQLKDLAALQKEYVEANDSINLNDFAYTLQIAREAMEFRCAFVAGSRQQLLQTLTLLAQGARVSGAFQGQCKEGKALVTTLDEDEDVSALIGAWMRKGKLPKLAKLWVRGLDVDWSGLYSADKPRRIALPCYPFAKERYWLPEAIPTQATSRLSDGAAEGVLHPLLHRNISTFAGQVYSSVFTGREFFLADHQVKQKRIMPGVALLEMAASAARLAMDIPAQAPFSVTLKHHVWLRPLTLEEKPLEIQISLDPQKSGDIAYEIYGWVTDGKSSTLAESSAGERVVYAQGRAVRREPDIRSDSVDLEALRRRCTRVITSDECHQAFQQRNVEYGPAFRGLKFVLVDSLGERQALASVELPQHLQATLPSYSLHPSVLDASVQSILALSVGSLSNPNPPSPDPVLAFSLDYFEQLDACPAVAWCWTRISETRTSTDGKGDGERGASAFDLDICDAHGRICIRMRALRLMARERTDPVSEKPLRAPAPGFSGGALMLTTAWDVVSGVLSRQPFPESLVLVGGDHGLQLAFQESNTRTVKLEADPSDSIEQIAAQLQAVQPVNHVMWVVTPMADVAAPEGADHHATDKGSLVFGFRLIKALLRIGLGASKLQWTVVTRRGHAPGSRATVNPFEAAIHGLFGSLAKEHPNWTVRLLNMEELSKEPLSVLFSLPAHRRGDTCIYRDGQYRMLKFVPYLPNQRRTSQFRNGGCYVVIGGAGRIGEAFTEYLVGTYRAQVIWLGRRKLDSEIEAKLDRLSLAGPAPRYICADAADSEALGAAVQTIKNEFGTIHGVIQSSLVFATEGLAEMEEKDFLSRLTAKVDVSISIAKVFDREPLDFLLLFSSIAAFIRNSNQSHYAAGCAFTDAFAQNLRKNLKCRVKVVNWGYWDAVSAGAFGSSDADGAYRDRMRQIGIDFIQPAEAMEALEWLLDSPLDQVIFVKTKDPNAIEKMGLTVDFSSVISVANEESCVRGDLPAVLARAPIAEPPASTAMSEDLCESFDGLMASILFGQLQALGLCKKPFVSVSQWISDVPIPGAFHRWIQESVSIVAKRGLLSPAGDIYVVLDSLERDVPQLWQEWEQRKAEWLADRVLGPRVHLVERTLRALPEILRGRLKSTDVLFSNASADLVETFYRNNPVSDYLNQSLAKIVNAFCEAEDREITGQLVHIIEVGAGTGSTTHAVLDSLEQDHHWIARYDFTDISKSFLQRAEERLGSQYPYLSFRAFDIERDSTAQGFGAGTYDIVIAANVIHTARDIRAVLRNMKRLLKRSGMLALVEISAKSLFSHLTFGLLDGWWAYQDEELRIPGSPAVSDAVWRTLLEEEGFRHVTFPVTRGEELGQRLVVAQSDGLVQSRLTAPNLVSAHAPGTAVNEDSSLRLPLGPLTQAGGGGTAGGEALVRRVRQAVVEKMARCLKLQPSDIDPEEPFADYGLDSILGIRLVQDLNRDLELELSVTSLFDYASVAKLADHMVKAGSTSLASRLTPGKVTNEIESPSERLDETVFRQGGHQERRSVSVLPPGNEPASQPIAIIGMSGKFAEAANVDELWEHLAQGHELVGDIVRWGNVRGAQRRMVGGFLRDIECFDPSFFNISGSEAACMDPQQRLFLEEAYKALEDAGYAGEAADGMRCGVYVGYNGGDYRQLIQGQPPAQAMWGNAPSVLSARIAYYLNMTGPAITIDSACSSSLVAIHLASQSLWAGETDMALAGGVSVYCTPWFYKNALRADMLSASGHTYTFDARADGFVPGEGAGVVVLKRLNDALTDRDHIYGIIRGSGINQDGATNGITAPSALSQERLERAVYERFRIQPEQIQMMEAHGTGTRLGDPIEFQAISSAFRHYSAKKQFCAIGSIKTNIGHTTAAAGVAGVIKVLLSLQNRQIPPSLNYEQGNPHIKFEDSPFFVNTTLRKWEASEQGHRCAAVSSFGMSGTNAHLVIEESAATASSSPSRNFHLVLLSARTPDQLKQAAERLATYCVEHPAIDCGNMSFTLIAGRKHLDYRLSVVVRDAADLVDQLNSWLADQQSSGVLAGKAKPDRLVSPKPFWDDDNVGERRHRPTFQHSREELLELAATYVCGGTLVTNELFPRGAFSRISLPVYPFMAGRYWYAGEQNRSNTVPLVGGTPVLHPFLHRNVSDLSEQRFASHFSGSEPLIADHIVQKHVLFPAVGYLEMIRAAIEASVSPSEAPTGDGVQAIRIRNMVWMTPLIIEPEVGVDVYLSLHPSQNEEVSFEVFTGPAKLASTKKGHDSRHERTIHAQGLVERFTTQVPRAKVEDARFSSSVVRIGSDECYELFRNRGLDYGPAYTGLKSVQVDFAGDGRQRVQAEVALPASAQSTKPSFVLHPSIMDAALQGCIGLVVEAGGGSLPHETAPALPFALDELEIYGPCSEQARAFIERDEEFSENEKLRKVNVEICDGNGSLFARLRGLTFRVLEAEAGPATLLFVPTWDKRLADSTISAQAVLVDRRTVILESEAAVQDDLTPVSLPRDHEIPEECKVVLRTPAATGERFECYAKQILEQVRGISRANPTRPVLLQIVTSTPEEDWLLLGLSGLLRTAYLENSKIVAQVVSTGAGLNPDVRSKLDNLAHWMNPGVIRYEGDSPAFLRFVEVTSQPEAMVPWRPGGVYVITGGLGGLGLLMAHEISARAGNCALILTGRSPMNPRIESTLAELRRGATQVEYKQADVSDRVEVDCLLAQVISQYGEVNGILHCAGVTRDGFLQNKTAEDLLAVFAPKVQGLLNLDEATRDLRLDIILLFSSVAAVLGNHGQIDYAAANSFMDAFAHHRNRLALTGERHGRTISINWPLWADGGMQVDKSTRERLDLSGVTPLTVVQGMEALYRAIALNSDQVLVLAGDPQRSRHKVAGLNPREAATVAPSATRTEPGALLDGLETWLLGKVSEILQVPSTDLDPEAELSDFGFDSISLTHFANALNKTCNLALMPTVFFQFPTLRSLSRHLLSEYQPAIEEHLFSTAKEIRDQEHTAHDVRLSSPSRVSARSRFLSVAQQPLDSKGPLHPDPVAVIGMSGRFPQAPDLDAFWQNLLNGKDCITDIPPSRWDWRACYGDPHREQDKTKANRGGFIEGIDEFDPLFFGISPRDAALMDPQQRLTMIYVWKAIEDAGYSTASLSGTNTGILIGTSGSDYNWLLAQGNDAYSATGIAPSVGPNRISYLLNIHGPSEPIETACSSSLVAIHRAMSLIAGRQCEMVIVGGVNAVISPRVHICFSKAGMLSDDGRCKTFSAEADGYGRGEGVGILILKRLSAAERDGDHIYGLLRGSAENHGGRATSLTAPNPTAQAKVIKEAHMAAGIDPRTIGYIEAHGTGTPLGDPIEINGLKIAFQQLHDAWQVPMEAKPSCGIASVKTNIGHLELAAGIAGVVKVLLQFRHKTLVKSLHVSPINPYIQLDESPFYIVLQNQEWVAPRDASGRDLPRRAGVSSFGFGGVNSHVVLEEYVSTDVPNASATIAPGQPSLIVLSAKSKSALRLQAAQLLQAITRLNDDELPHLAYTLQVGRDAMSHRLAFVVRSLRGASEKLQAFLAGDGNLPECYRGEVKPNQGALPSVFRDEDLRQTLALWIEKEKYSKLLELWVQGVDCNWETLHNGQRRRRLALPTYPFAKERCWITSAPELQRDLENRVTPRQDDDFLDLLLEEVRQDAKSVQSAAANILEFSASALNGNHLSEQGQSTL